MRGSNSPTSNTTAATGAAASSKDFANYFDKKLPLHRLLYHLEALSSRIMPAVTDSNTLECAELFQQVLL